MTEEYTEAKAKMISLFNSQVCNKLSANTSYEYKDYYYLFILFSLWVINTKASLAAYLERTVIGYMNLVAFPQIHSNNPC